MVLYYKTKNNNEKISCVFTRKLNYNYSDHNYGPFFKSSMTACVCACWLLSIIFIIMHKLLLLLLLLLHL